VGASGDVLDRKDAHPADYSRHPAQNLLAGQRSCVRYPIAILEGLNRSKAYPRCANHEPVSEDTPKNRSKTGYSLGMERMRTTITCIARESVATAAAAPFHHA
jgi:hypothetical protein